jgi:hypothetical protein
MDAILDSSEEVRGVIYCIEHIATGKKYVGQTHSHRKNHNRYRPFGAEGRFRDHVSCALRNTKTSQCSALYNDIRQYGRDAFKWSQLEICASTMLDQREQFWITELNTTHPTGYNLTIGGRVGCSLVTQIGISTPLNPVGSRGGCSSRSEETRAIMSKRAKELVNHEFCEARATSATAQHAANKAARFKDVKVDITNLDQYIFTKGVRVNVRIGDQIAHFAGKSNTQEENKERAREFLLSLS